MLTNEEKKQMEAQVALSKRLAFGFALSLVTAGGVSSIAAFWIGLRAYRKISSSEQELHGVGMAVWCILVGALGALLGLSFWIYLLFIKK